MVKKAGLGGGKRLGGVKDWEGNAGRDGGGKGDGRRSSMFVYIDSANSEGDHSNR